MKIFSFVSFDEIMNRMRVNDFESKHLHRKRPPKHSFGGLAVFQPLRIWLKDP
jgi:hypothetical protein